MTQRRVTSSTGKAIMMTVMVVVALAVLINYDKRASLEKNAECSHQRLDSEQSITVDG